MSVGPDTSDLEIENPMDGIAMSSGTMSPQLRESIMGGGNEEQGGPAKTISSDEVWKTIQKWVAMIATSIAGLFAMDVF